MGAPELLEHALKLRPGDRLALVEGILNSLSGPDHAPDYFWSDDAGQRLHAFRHGHLEVISMDEVFNSA